MAVAYSISSGTTNRTILTGGGCGPSGSSDKGGMFTHDKNEAESSAPEAVQGKITAWDSGLPACTFIAGFRPADGGRLADVRT